MAGAASAEMAVDGGGHFGLVPPGGVATAAENRESGSAPSFQQPPRTGVVLQGNGRFGLLYQEQGDASADVTVSTRLRLDIDVSHETDSGVTFGGRVRAQASAGSGTTLNAPTLYATWN
jgi:hypothetical protein